MRKTIRGVMQCGGALLVLALLLEGTADACDPKPTPVNKNAPVIVADLFEITPVVKAGRPLPGGTGAHVTTKIYTLSYLDPKGVVQVARELLGRRSETVLVTLPGTRTLIAKGSLRELRYLTTLIVALDTAENQDQRKAPKRRRATPTVEKKKETAVAPPEKAPPVRTAAARPAAAR